jgi:hypothetical protein
VRALELDLSSLRSNNAGLLSSLAHMEAEAEALHEEVEKLQEHASLLQVKMDMVGKPGDHMLLGLPCLPCHAIQYRVMSAAWLACWDGASCAPG